MWRSLGIGFVIIGISSTPVVAVEWRTPAVLASEIDAPLVAINRTFRAPLDGPALPDQVLSVGSISALRELAPVAGTWVMFDLERWGPTSTWEQNHPLRAMRRFVREAHAMGLHAILAPSGHFRDRATALRADAFHAQIQHFHDPAGYGAKVREIVAAFDGPVIAQLTVNAAHPGHAVEDLLRQYRAGLRWTDRFALWGDPEMLAVAQEFMSLVAHDDPM